MTKAYLQANRDRGFLVTPGRYVMRNGERAIVEIVEYGNAFGVRGFDKDTMWDNVGRHRFKKYCLVKRIED